MKRETDFPNYPPMRGYWTGLDVGDNWRIRRVRPAPAWPWVLLAVCVLIYLAAMSV